MIDLLERVISVSTLRTLVRLKRGAGVTEQTISQLIASCVDPEMVIEYEDKNRSRPGRLPIELIPPYRRGDFLEALHRLPTSRTFVRSKIASLGPETTIVENWPPVGKNRRDWAHPLCT